MKEIYRNDDVIAYDGFKDSFGNKMYIVINETLNELRLYGKNEEYKKRRKQLNENKLHHVIIPKWLEVIDISEQTAKKLEKEFPMFKRYKYQILESVE